MARPLTPIVITQFAGENDTSPATEIEDQQGFYIQNLYIVNGGLEQRLGSERINTDEGSGHSIQGLLWCRIPAVSPTEYVLGVDQGVLKDFYNAGSVTFPTSKGTVCTSTSNKVDMAVVDSTVYAADGTDPMIRFNGTNLRKAGSSAPTTAPTFNAFVGAGVLTGDVTYKLVYLDADGNESEASAASAVISPSAQNVTLNIANDVDADRSGKNLYRRGVTSTEYKLVNSSPISASATTYTDSTADADLGATLVTGNTLFPSCSHLWEHDNRLIGCGNAADPRTLFISNEFEPWYCPASPDLSDPTQGLRLRIQARNATIVGGISHGGYCFVFTDEGGYILHGTSSDDYRLERFTSHGCAAHRTIQSVRNWLFWMGPDGVYRYDGAEVIRIDDDIRTFFLARTASQLATACAWSYDDRYYLSFIIGGNPGRVKCFDTRHDAWTTLRYTNTWAAATTAPSQGANAGVPRVFVSQNTNQNGVVQLEKPGVYDSDDNASGATGAAAITATWISKLFNAGQFGRDKRIHLWGAKFRKQAGAPLLASMYLFANGESTGSFGNAIQTVSFISNLTDNGDDWAGDATTPTVAVVRNEAVEQARSELFQIAIVHTTSLTTTSDLYRILEVEAYWTLAG